ncbi:MAG: YaaR family protein [Bacteroidota bacterium]
MEVKSTGSKQVGAGNEAFARTPGINSKQTAFSDTLRETDNDRRRQACDELLRQIDSVSDILKKAPTPNGIKKYRRLVASFIREAINQTYELNEETHWDRSGNRKSYLTVRNINQALEELTDEVMNREKKQIDLVAKLDEIRGMLLDLYM